MVRQVALNTHISGKFNIELENLRNSVLTMGGEVELQLIDTRKASQQNNAGLAEKAIFHFFPKGCFLQRLVHCIIEKATNTNTLQAQAVAHIIINAHWKRVGPLEYHAHLCTQLRDVFFAPVDIAVTNINAAVITTISHQIVHPVKATDKRRFPTSALTDECSNAVFRNAHADIVQYMFLTELQIQLLDPDSGVSFTEILYIQGFVFK